VTDTLLDGRPAAGEVRIGHIFSSAWQIFTANFVKFFIITAVIALPSTLLVAWSPQPITPASPGFGWRIGLGGVLAFVLHMLAQAIILYIAFQYLRGQTASLGDAFQKALPRLLPILGAIVLVLLGWTIGFVLLVIPGVMLMVRWSVAVPACLLERLGPLASLKRSAELTKGHRWKIFGTFLPVWLVSLIVSGLLTVFARLLGPTVVLAAKLVWAAAWGAYFNSVWVMVYHDLRVAKDGVDIEQIAAVFD